MKQVYRWWPVAGGIAGLLISAGFFTRLNALRDRPGLFFWLFLALLMLHHFEEFVLPGGIQTWFNRMVMNSADPASPFSDGRAFVNNVVFGWSGFVLAALVGTRLVWAAFIPMFVLLFDAWFHLSYTVASGRYSPGSITGLILVTPVTFYAVSSFLQWDAVSYGAVSVAAALGFVVNVSFFIVMRQLKRADAETTRAK